MHPVSAPNTRLWPWLALHALLAWLMLAGTNARAAVPAEGLAQATALAAQAAQARAPQAARIVALPGPADPRLQLAPCAQTQAFLLAGAPAWGKSRVGLRCVKGPVAWQVFVPVTVQVWAPAAVSTAALPAGARLDESQFTQAEVDWAAAATPPHALPADLSERVLARPLAAGQPVRSTDLRTRQFFAAGDTVRLVAQGPGFAASSEGQAMQPGVEGQPVRVRTDSGRVVLGTASGPRRVELGP